MNPPEPTPTSPVRARPPGLTVYGCTPDEADLFHDLAPCAGIALTTTGDAVADAVVRPRHGHRYVSVSHRSELSQRELQALRAAGVDHVSTRSIGLDHIDLDAAEELGITVENVVYAPDGVADFTVMLILMAIRNAGEVLNSVGRHDFRLGRVRGRDLRDMTVGVVGAGPVGQAVIGRLRGFGCRVLACNRTRGAVTTAGLVSLDDLLLESDVVTLHLPLNAATRHVLGRPQIETMKPGAFLVNTGRGALVDTEALLEAMESGRLGGAALDVLEGEEGLFHVDHTTGPVDNRFLLRLEQLPNAVVTPHTAYHTVRTLRDTVAATLTQCLTFERNRTDEEAEGRDPVRGLLRGA